MKRFRSGFTLAEVLITLAIIGIVSAIILPSVMSNYQYKSVGVKLGKFVSTVEGAARAFVVNDDGFSDSAGVTNFVNESFIIKQFEGKDNITAYPRVGNKNWVASDRGGMNPDSSEFPVAILKDGTGIRVSIDHTSFTDVPGGIQKNGIVPVEKYGVPAFRIDFNPNVQGLPKTAQKVFSFTVTELGYVFPHNSDNCTWDLYNDGFNTTARAFAVGTSCHIDAGT